MDEANDTGLDSNPVAREVAVVDELLILTNGDPLEAELALLIALDRGCAPETMLAAITDGQFKIDGIVVDGDGNDVVPVVAGADVIVDKVLIGAAGFAKRSAARDSVTIAELRDLLEKDVETADLGYGKATAPPPERRAEPWEDLSSEDAFARGNVLRILSLISLGFSAEQMVIILVLGSETKCVYNRGRGENYCTLDGEPIGGAEEPETVPTPPDGAADETAATTVDAGVDDTVDGEVAALADGVYETFTDIDRSTEKVLSTETEFEVANGTPSARYLFLYESDLDGCIRTWSNEWTSTGVAFADAANIVFSGEVVKSPAITVANCGNSYTVQPPNAPYDLEVTFRSIDGELVGPVGNELFVVILE